MGTQAPPCLIAKQPVYCACDVYGLTHVRSRLKRSDQIARIKITISVPIAFVERRVTVDSVFVFACLEEGDWDGDGDFTTTDLVFAFQQGNYVNAANKSLFESSIDDRRLTMKSDRERDIDSVFMNWLV